MSGYLANLFSLKMKIPDVRAPMITRQRTCGDFQGNVTPPNSSPRKIISVAASIEILPNQSTALSPSITGVFWVVYVEKD